MMWVGLYLKNKKFYIIKKVDNMQKKNKCPYRYKDFERCPNRSCRVFLDKVQKKCSRCKKDIKESYMTNVKNGHFA
jgi:hypothetical protein